MPEIIRKVAEAKRLLETGEKTTVNGAAREVGISRSAFYKYKDAVHPFQDMLHGRIVTLQTVLRDEPGVLSGVFPRSLGRLDLADTQGLEELVRTAFGVVAPHLHVVRREGERFHPAVA